MQESAIDRSEDFVLMVVISRRWIDEYITCEYVLQVSRSHDVKPLIKRVLVSGRFRLAKETALWDFNHNPKINET
jgi:hypothetical protein